MTRKDSGGRAFNWSGVLGLIRCEQSIDDALKCRLYAAIGRRVMSVIDHWIDEFGPDLERKFLRRK